MIINTRADLEAMRGGPDYGRALAGILGSAYTWVNNAPEGAAPDWERVTVLSTIQRMGFLSLDDLLAECAAAGVAPPEPTPPTSIAPEPAPEAAPSCTDLQFRLALNQLGLREAVEAYVATASQDVRDWWERATTIHADNPMLIEAATALGKTQADIDAAIELGRTLT